MKLQIMSLLIATTIMVSCSTTQSSTSSNAAYGNMPQSVRVDFERHYPDASNVLVTHYDAATLPIDWELTDWTALDANDYVVSFNMGSDQYYAWYDSDGTWIGTAYAMSSSILPSDVTATLNSKFAGYAIDSIQKETWKDKTAYELKLDNGTNKVKLLVDAQGNILKQKDKY
jgi:hypothetical protein